MYEIQVPCTPEIVILLSKAKVVLGTAASAHQDRRDQQYTPH